MAIAPTSSTPCVCAVRFVSLKRPKNPESSGKYDAARPSEDHLPGYLSHEPSAFFDFGLWTASTESREVITRHVLKHASRKELAENAKLGRMNVNGEDVVFDVFHERVITCFRVPEDEHLDVDKALEAVTYTWKGTGRRPTQVIAFECDTSWRFDHALRDDRCVFEEMMKMPDSQSACLKIIDKIIREGLDYRIVLFMGNEDAYAEPLKEWPLQVFGDCKPHEFYGNGYKYMSWLKFYDSVDLLASAQRRLNH